MRECVALVEKASIDSEEMVRKAAEYVDATEGSFKRLSDEISELDAGWRQAIAENAALEDENARLRAELEELRQSRTM